MLALGWLVYFSFGLAFASTAALALPIAADLRLDSAQLGLVLGAWQLVYIGFAFFAGLIVDRFGLRRAMSVGALVMALSAILRAFAVDFATVFLAVALFGLGGPLITVGANKLVSVWFDVHGRGVALGAIITGPTVGQVSILALANSVLVPLTDGWRGAMVVCAAVSLVAALVWLVFAREPTRAVDRAAIGERPQIGAGASAVLRSRNVQLLLVGSISCLAITHGLNGWIPTILVSHSFTLPDAGFWAAASTGVGLVSVLLLPRTVSAGHRRYVLAGLGLCTGLAIFGLTVTDGAPLLAALVVIGMSRAAMSPLMLLLMMETDVVGSRRMGTATGLFYAVGEIGGFGGPAMIGWLFGLTGSFFAPLGVLAVMSLAAAALALPLRESARRLPAT